MNNQLKRSWYAVLDWQRDVQALRDNEAKQSEALRGINYQHGPEWYYMKNVIKPKWEQLADQRMASIRQEQ